MGISRACASKWVNRWRRATRGCRIDRPHHTAAQAQPRRGSSRRSKRGVMSTSGRHSGSPMSWQTSGARSIAAPSPGTSRGSGSASASSSISTAKTTASPRKITARRPGHLVHLDAKKAGRIPRRRRVADPRSGQQAGQGCTSGVVGWREAWLRLPALHRRRVLPTCLHRTPGRREGRYRGCVPLSGRPSEGALTVEHPK